MIRSVTEGDPESLLKIYAHCFEMTIYLDRNSKGNGWKIHLQKHVRRYY